MKRVCVRGLSDDGSFVYVGRKCGCFSASPLGNPFKIGVDGDREAVIKKYRAWLWECIGSADESVLNALSRVERVGVVGCWCSLDEACHGDVVVNCVEWMKKEEGL